MSGHINNYSSTSLIVNRRGSMDAEYSIVCSRRFYGLQPLLGLILTRALLTTMFNNPFSAGTDFSRQNLTSVDVRFCRLKSIPH